MPWAKLSDDYPVNLKVEAASLALVGAHALAIARASREMTDGVVPKVWLRKRGLTPRQLQRGFELVLFEPVDELHVQVHDYLDANPSAEQWHAEREKSRRTSANHRAKKAT